MQTDRLFEIIYILLQKKKVTASELAEHFGVSRRTICRDIDTLSLSNIPVYAEKGKGGGIRLMPEFVLNKSILSEQEQDEILSALQSLSSIQADDTNKTLQKLSAIFDKTTTNWLEVDFSGWSYENDYWGELKRAILERYVVAFDYYNSNGNKTVRRALPVQLWFKSRAWYLKGFCLTRQDMRLYKLSRIKNLVVTDEHFSKRDSLVVSGNPVPNPFREYQNTTIKFRIEPEMAYRVYDDFYESMVEKQADGSFIVAVTWQGDEWLNGYVLSYGKYIEVLEPAHIRKAIKDNALEIAKKYL